MLVDTHAHLTGGYLNACEVIENMENDGLSIIITIGTDENDSKEAISLANRYDGIYATVGLHPEYANSYDSHKEQILLELAKNKKVVAVGEIGLDYHYSGYDKQKQRKVFESQIDLANTLNLPIAVHVRDAMEDALDILTQNKSKLHGGIIHCFSGSIDDIQRIVKLGLYVSFAGNITYKKGNEDIIKTVPIDRLLTETDSPFLSPVPVRRQSNQPKNVKYTNEYIANVLDMNIEKLEEILLKNTKKVYRLP